MHERVSDGEKLLAGICQRMEVGRNNDRCQFPWNLACISMCPPIERPAKQRQRRLTQIPDFAGEDNS